MDLGLVPTDDLIREIYRRCDHGLVAFLRVGEEGALIGKHRSTQGNPETVMGLAIGIIRMVLDQMDQNEINESEEEDPGNGD